MTTKVWYFYFFGSTQKEEMETLMNTMFSDTGLTIAGILIAIILVCAIRWRSHRCPSCKGKIKLSLWEAMVKCHHCGKLHLRCEVE